MAISIMCRVAAVFRNDEGGMYKVKPLQIDNDAPEWIQKDRLFDLLVKDGSLVIATTPAVKRSIENDPTKGAGPDGKAIKTQTSGGRRGKQEKAAGDPNQQEEHPEEGDGADAK